MPVTQCSRGGVVLGLCRGEYESGRRAASVPCGRARPLCGTARVRTHSRDADRYRLLAEGCVDPRCRHRSVACRPHVRPRRAEPELTLETDQGSAHSRSKQRRADPVSRSSAAIKKRCSAPASRFPSAAAAASALGNSWFMVRRSWIRLRFLRPNISSSFLVSLVASPGGSSACGRPAWSHRGPLRYPPRSMTCRERTARQPVQADQRCDVTQQLQPTLPPCPTAGKGLRFEPPCRQP